VHSRPWADARGVTVGETMPCLSSTVGVYLFQCYVTQYTTNADCKMLQLRCSYSTRCI